LRIEEAKGVYAIGLGSYLRSDQSEYVNIREFKEDWDFFFAASMNSGRQPLWRLIHCAVWKKVYGI
jgi:hypothetical protein